MQIMIRQYCNRLFFIKFFTTVSILLLLTSCTNFERDPEKLTYWCSSNTEEIDFARYITAEWNSKNPGNPISYKEHLYSPESASIRCYAETCVEKKGLEPLSPDYGETPWD